MFIHVYRTGLQLLTKVYLNVHKSVTLLENQSHLALAVAKNIALFDVEKREFLPDKMAAPFITQHGMVYMSGKIITPFPQPPSLMAHPPPSPNPYNYHDYQ